MMLIIRRFLIIIFVTLFFISITPNEVYACSFGAPPSLESELESGVIIVRGEVIETDYLGQNFMLRVESYLTGDVGNEYVLVRRNHPAQVEGVLGGQLSGDACHYIEPEVTIGERGVVLLGRSAVGYYFINNYALVYNHAIIPGNPDQEVSFYRECEACDDGVERTTATFDDFVTLLQELTGETSRAPITDAFMPMTQQLVITTDVGTDYILPVDGLPEPIMMTPDNLNWWMRVYFGSVMRHYVDSSFDRFNFSDDATCLELSCLAFSANGLQFAYPIDENILRLPYGYELEGERVSFSPNGDFIAVWDEGNLLLYDLEYQVFVQDSFGAIGESLELTLLIETVLDDSTIDLDVVWSANSRLLAYHNADGLWVWDSWLPEIPPHLLIPTDDNDIIPIAQYFSPIDDYLTLLIGDQLQTIEVASGAMMTGGLVSPQADYLLSAVRYPIAVMPIQDIFDNGESVGNFDVPEMVWLDEAHYAWLLNFAGGCVYHTQDLNSPISRDFEAYEVTLCTASTLTQDYWVIADQSRVIINGQIIDLTGTLDGAIVSLQWLPPLFYDG